MNDASLFLREALEHAAHALPAQAPIRRFVHHNTLHGFEHLPFEEAVVEAAAMFDAEPYLPEEDFHALVADGRIEPERIAEVLAEDGIDDTPIFPGGPGRRALRAKRLLHPPPPGTGETVRFRLAETDLLRRPHDGAPRPPGDVSVALSALFEEAESLARAMPALRPAPRSVRLRDLFVSAGLDDPDALVNPFLARVLSAYLDQGIAYWPMPDRARGFYLAFRALYANPASAPSPWRAKLRGELARQEHAGFDAEAAALDELGRLGVPRERWEELLRRTLLALPGWTGMARQLEEGPERAPVEAPPIALLDVVAVRLLLDRLAAEHVGATALGTRDLRGLREALVARARDVVPEDVPARALALFVLAQLAGVSGYRMREVGGALVRELDAFDGLARRRVYQLAYERRFLHAVVDAIAASAADAPPRPAAAPKAQLVFCIDDREESMRRHLEELDPRIETYGFAGFFGVAMLHHAEGAARPRALCPVVVTPRHLIREEPASGAGAKGARSKLVGRLAHEASLGSRTLVRGGALSLFAQVEAAPMIVRTLFPRWAAALAQKSRAAIDARGPTALAIERRDPGGAETPEGLLEGYTVAEMTSTVALVLRSMGLVRDFAPLVAFFGHGSTSVNNPHEAAYDCGACSGSKGGPNARAFAAMANHPEVRRALGESGIAIPGSTWFLGGYHDTGSDAVELFDLDRVPAALAGAVSELRRDLDAARALDAHERCRRFEHVGLDVGPAEALRHVEDRAADLGQPRPECGHATNAICVVGRRALTRGLFLDRRAFLTSYDPTIDPSGELLRGLLAAAIPVCAGINLEYWFSYVDPRRYGCGTKLPQNVAGLLGVMDGHSSDLRTGLPWQMVEIHEPLRLVCIVEAPVDRLAAVLDRLPDSKRLVANRWVHLLALDPDSRRISRFGATGFEPCEPSGAALPTAPRSVDWYRGRRDHLAFARIAAAQGRAAAQEVSP